MVPHLHLHLPCRFLRIGPVDPDPKMRLLRSFLVIPIHLPAPPKTFFLVVPVGSESTVFQEVILRG